MAVSICIHRGADTIGGSCIEIKASSGKRLLLDVGRPLDTPSDQETPLPETLDVNKDASILLSHAHIDHCGMLPALPLSWPVYSGKDTETLLRLTSAVGKKEIIHSFKHWEHEKKFSIGPFTITPYLIDHSAFDAYALHIEAEGKSVFYSGDIRAHGRKASLTERLLKIARKVDILLLEGTNLCKVGKQAKPTPTEADLENDFVKAFKETEGRVFVSTSSTNIDRLVTLYRACKRSGRTLVVDLYTMLVLRKLQNCDSLPQPEWGDKVLRVIVTRKMLNLLERLKEENNINTLIKLGVAFGAATLENSKTHNSVIMMRDSLACDYKSKGVIPTEKDLWIFSLWGGYLTQDSTKYQREFLAPCKFKHIHTSGHAPLELLQTLAESFNPTKLIPVHGEAWPEHEEYFKNMFFLGNGEWLEL